MALDVKFKLDMMRQQLNWIEREMLILREKLNQPGTGVAPISFESLQGIWAEVVFNEDDFKSSRLQLPENL
jgi:hypothetical protein